MPRGRPMHNVICSGLAFTPAGTKGISSIANRYKLGKMEGGNLYLTPFEGLFLFYKGKIKPENSYFYDATNLMRELLPDPSDILLYTVYEKVKSKGLYVKREAESLFYRKSSKEQFLGPLRVIREGSDLSFSKLLKLHGSLVAALDDENDITYFKVGKVDPHGEGGIGQIEKVMTSTVSDRKIAYGPGLPDWIGNSFRGVRFLTELEDCLVKTINGQDDACSEHPLFRIYSDLVTRKLIVKTGFKYGTNFRAYTKTMDAHADFLIHYFSDSEEWYKISRAVRVAHGVHKTMIFAGFNEGNIDYVSVERVRDPFVV